MSCRKAPADFTKFLAALDQRMKDYPNNKQTYKPTPRQTAARSFLLQNETEDYAFDDKLIESLVNPSD